MKRILIVGATSAIAEATARQFAARADMLFLVGRRSDALGAVASDLALRGGTVAGTALMDARDPSSMATIVPAAVQALGTIDQVLIAHGTLSNQRACEASPSLLQEEFAVNALSTMTLCLEVARYLVNRRAGVIAVISSVAGDRGRQSNFVYGAAKASLSAFLSGLGQRLRRSNVHVVVIKPGFVSTPMTAAFKKGALWATPDRVAHDIRRAMDAGTPVLYTPWFWRPVMFIIRSIPETLFRRLSL